MSTASSSLRMNSQITQPAEARTFFTGLCTLTSSLGEARLSAVMRGWGRWAAGHRCRALHATFGSYREKQNSFMAALTGIVAWSDIMYVSSGLVRVNTPLLEAL